MTATERTNRGRRSRTLLFRAELGVILLLVSCNEPEAERGSAVTVRGAGVEVFVANGLGETISVVSYGEESRLARDCLEAGLAPTQLVCRGDEGYLVNSLSHTVQVIDLATRRTRRLISTGLGTNPMALAFLPDHAEPRAYVSAFVTGEVRLVNLGGGGAGGVLETIPLPHDLPRDPGAQSTHPFPGGLVAAGGKLFVALGNLRGDNGGLRAGGPGVVAVIPVDPADPDYHQVTERIELAGRDTISVARSDELPGIVMAVSAGDYDAGGGFRGNGFLEFIGVATNRVAGVMNLAGFHGGAAPFEVLVAGQTGYLADAKQGRLITFSAVDVRERLSSVPAAPADLSDCLRDVILLPGSEDVLSYASGLAASGNYLFVTEFNHDRLLKIEIATGRIVEALVIGDGPDAIAVWEGRGSENPLTTVAGFLWYGQAWGGEVTAYDSSGEEGARALCDNGGRFTLELPAGAFVLEGTAASLSSPLTGERRPWPAGMHLRTMTEGGASAVTPLSELAVGLAVALGDGSGEGIRRAALRLGRHFGGTPVLGVPDDPLTAAVEGDRVAGLIMAAVAVLAETLAHDDPGALFDALALDGADDRFDGLYRGEPILVAGESLPARAACDLLAAAANDFARAATNISGGDLPAPLDTYLRETSGVLPPAEGLYDYLPPRAEAGPDQSAGRGAYIRFDGSGSRDDGEIVSYAWDFDDSDGLTVDAVGAVVFHAYPQTGEYVVTLTVRDGAGNEGQDTALVTVRDSPEELLLVEPNETYLRSGETLALAATLNGEAVPAVWSSSDPAVVRLEAGARLGAVGPGAALVEAVYRSMRGTILAHVDQDVRTAAYDRSAYAVRPGRPALEITDETGTYQIDLPAGASPSAVAVWAGKTAFVATTDSLLAVDLRGRDPVQSMPAGQADVLLAGTDHVFQAIGSELRVIATDTFAAYDVPTSGEVTALGRDAWGRLWVAYGDSVHVLGPGFCGSGDQLISTEGARAFSVGGARIGGFLFSRFHEEVLLWDQVRDRLYVVPLLVPDPRDAGEGLVHETVAAITVELSDGGYGLSDCSRLSDGRVVAESRKGGRVYTFRLDRSYAPVDLEETPLRWPEKVDRIVSDAERPAEAVFADTLCAYDVAGRPGSYMNPLLALGEPRGTAGDAGSTHVVSLGDRSAAAGPADPGRGGALTVGFHGHLVYDGPGPDVVVCENPFRVAGAGGLYCEAAFVQVSQDGVTWHEFPWRVEEERGLNDPRRYRGLAGTTPVRLNTDGDDAAYFPLPAYDPAAGGDRFDLALLGLRWIRYVRVVDAGGTIEDSGNLPFFAERGADIDAVAALHHTVFPFAGDRDTEHPTAVIRVAPEVPPEGGSLLLTASDSFDNRGIRFFAWDLDHQDGDFTLDSSVAFGADATGPEVRVTAEAAGPHTVSLLVVDEAGNTDRSAVTVQIGR